MLGSLVVAVPAGGSHHGVDVVQDDAVSVLAYLVVDESFEQGGLDYPSFTRPAVFEGMAVPDVLLSGHHERIEAWRAQSARDRTLRCRPELLGSGDRAAGDRRE